MVTLGPGHGPMLFGGETAPPPADGRGLTDAWVFEGGEWASVPACTQGWGNAIAYDAESDRVVVHAVVGPEFEALNQTWAYDPVARSWRQMSGEGAPGSMHAPLMAHDTESDLTVLFGTDGATWAYDVDVDEWTRMTPYVSPPSRDFHVMAYDSQSDRVVVFGGIDRQDRSFADTWALDLNSRTWTDMQPAVAPAARFYSAATYDPVRDRIVLFGGADGSFLAEVPFADTWTYDLDTNTWEEQAPAVSPPARGWHAMAFDTTSERIVLFGGGVDRDHFQADTWLYDPVANTWFEVR